MHRLFELAILGLLAVATTARSPSKSQVCLELIWSGGKVPYDAAMTSTHKWQGSLKYRYSISCPTRIRNAVCPGRSSHTQLIRPSFALQHRVLSSVRGGDAPPKPDLPLPEVPAAVPVSSPATAPVDFSAHANHVAAAHANHMAAENAVVEGHKEAPLLPPAPAEATLPVPATPVQVEHLDEARDHEGTIWLRSIKGLLY